jgi:hypothetical protein
MEYIGMAVTAILLIRSILEKYYEKEQMIQEKLQRNYDSKEEDEKELNRRKEF